METVDDATEPVPVHPTIRPELARLEGHYEDRRVLVTGGLGFIGSAVVHQLAHLGADTLILDAGTYAANPRNLRGLSPNGQTRVQRADIADPDAVRSAWSKFEPEIVLHLAAESHVDRSIEDASAFTRTNVEGTRVLLDTLRTESDPDTFVHVGTDEVYGDIPPDSDPVSETARLKPSSPYSASKTSGDLMALAYIRTYGCPVRVTRGSNTYGPRQFPEKLIPVMLTKALDGEPLPVYGDGKQRRDWLHVDDHARALLTVGAKGSTISGPRMEPHEWAVLNVAYGEDITNLALLEELLATAAAYSPDVTFEELWDRIEHVEDRPGHDRRYALDATRIQEELGWEPVIDLSDGIDHTVRWYLRNKDWIEAIQSERYRKELADLFTGEGPVNVDTVTSQSQVPQDGFAPTS